MKRLSLLVFLILGLRAQDVTDVLSISNAARVPANNIFSITGTDGTVCLLNKTATQSIASMLKCTDPTGKVLQKSTPITATGTGTAVVSAGMGQVLCLIALNPTSAPVAFGSVGTAPANGLTYACTPGDDTIKTGTVVWP